MEYTSPAHRMIFMGFDCLQVQVFVDLLVPWELKSSSEAIDLSIPNEFATAFEASPSGRVCLPSNHVITLSACS